MSGWYIRDNYHHWKSVLVFQTVSQWSDALLTFGVTSDGLCGKISCRTHHTQNCKRRRTASCDVADPCRNCSACRTCHSGNSPCSLHVLRSTVTSQGPRRKQKGERLRVDAASTPKGWGARRRHGSVLAPGTPRGALMGSHLQKAREGDSFSFVTDLVGVVSPPPCNAGLKLKAFLCFRCDSF